MSDVHPIRLHGPWQAELLERFGWDTAESHPEQRVTIPSDWSDWLGPSFRGRVAYHRTFHSPTGLEPDQQVWLVIEQVDYCGLVFLNEHSIGSLRLGHPPLKVEVNPHLLEFNRLRIEVELPNDVERGDRSASAGGLIGSVRLEIEESVTPTGLDP